MNMVDTLTEEQKNQLIEIKNEYIEFIKLRGENKFLRDRINEIDNELKETGKSMSIKRFD